MISLDYVAAVLGFSLASSVRAAFAVVVAVVVVAVVVVAVVAAVVVAAVVGRSSHLLSKEMPLHIAPGPFLFSLDIRDKFNNI